MRLLLGAVAIAAALTACTGNTVLGSDRTSGLGGEIQSKDGVGAALADTKPNQPYLMGNMRFCVDKDPAQITSVTLDPPLRGQLRLDGWGIRLLDAKPAGEDDPGALPGTISQYHGFTHEPIKTLCEDEDTSATEFLLQIERTSAQSATIPSVLVDYTIGTKHGRARQYLQISLCAHGDPYAKGRCD